MFVKRKLKTPRYCFDSVICFNTLFWAQLKLYVQGGRTLKARNFKMMLICLDWLDGYGARKGHKQEQEQKCLNAVGRKKQPIKYSNTNF